MKAVFFGRMALVICLLSGICLYSCKKDTSSNGNDTTQTDAATSGDDEQQVSDESDIITNDVNTALSGSEDFSGASTTTIGSGQTTVNSTGASAELSINVHQLICDASVSYDTVGSDRVVTITYDGTNCWGNRKREGVITISMTLGQRWKDAGAIAVVTITNLKITRLRDGKVIVLNGSKNITNETGGLLKDLSSLHTIIHSISGNLKIDFSNNTSRTWNVSKQRTFTYDNGIVITTIGTHSDGTDSDIADWGTNRFGNSFTSRISAPIVIRQDCDFRLTGGQHTVVTDNATAVITYGLDAGGEPTTCPAGDYYFKLVWTGKNGKTYTIIWPY